MKLLLAGQPNCGKTTLFNELTRQNQKVGNWPGVTVEMKTGKYYADKSIEIVDLPGAYSINAVTEDENVARKALLEGGYDAVINVIESTNLQRSLAFTLQLLELNLPVVLALNMEDELAANGLTIDTAAIERELKIKACLISARKRRNVKALIELAKTAKKPENAIAFDGSEEEKAAKRHEYIASKIPLFAKKTVSKAKKLTNAIDKIVMNKWLAFPIFAVVIWLVYFISIQTVGALAAKGLTVLFNDIIGGGIRRGLENAGAARLLTSLICDGIIAGVGAVLSFIPQIVMLFFFITFLEGCGYMPRVAVLMDRLFRRLGLSGKSFIPMIVGCGCSVPAIMAAKTVDGETERKATVMLTPFVPCSAKLPVFALIAGALFPHNSFVAPSMYFLGILSVILGGLILRLFKKGKAADAFVFELPKYRLPHARNVVNELWDKVKGFVVRAGLIILPATVVLWTLQSFSFSFKAVGVEDSMLATIGRIVAYIFVPLGFGNWQSSIALITGILAKETVVATFGVLLSGDIDVALRALMTPHAAYAFMAFVLLSAPCVAAIAAAKKELGTKSCLVSIAFQTAFAYIVALIINQTGNLFKYSPALFLSIFLGGGVAVASVLCVIKLMKNKKTCKGGCASCGKCKAVEK